MSLKDLFDELIEEAKSDKETLLDMLEEIKKRNEITPVITDEEYNNIKSRIEQLPE
jgi:predicted small metal-binding protein